MTYGLEIKKKVFHGNDCEKVVDVLDNEIPRSFHYDWRNDKLIVWKQNIDELSEEEADDFYDKLDKIGIECEIYEEEDDDYDPDWEKEYELIRYEFNRLIKIR